ncbi:hypothetical protein HW130_13680 [Streptomyces sp. PKU-EA00015]|uniref:hypothetical protein n=1 Tax=Streptomyces sp. PKU-EA00015 TaxID=2748326 RepID=UPI0015A12B9E|nr:hypothetical protein [Streptomyces sp. PKU-EA00015]NWF27310.1 hypothetical protein [Streptomyces sp. PKU-EA00015]
MSDAASPYLATADFEWTERAFRLLESQQLTVSRHGAGDVPGYVVSGPCPRCGHHFTDRQVLVALAGLSGPDRQEHGGVVPAAVVLDVTCGCGSAHDDAPEGTAGCGASFRIELVTE